MIRSMSIETPSGTWKITCLTYVGEYPQYSVSNDGILQGVIKRHEPLPLSWPESIRNGLMFMSTANEGK